MGTRKVAPKSAKAQGLEKLEEEGFISDLSEEVNRKFCKFKWLFNLGHIDFNYGGKTTTRDFSKYRLRIEYRPNKTAPMRIKVFIDSPEMEREKHFWRDGSLCLYKHQNFRWENRMTIREDLFASICTWLYHHEVWLETGVWYGEEASH